MTKNPFINAISAAAYICLIAVVMYYGSSLAPKPDIVLAPIAALSLFTLSAAVMGYIFFFQPFQLYFDGKRKQAIKLFLQTVAVFGVITATVLLILFSGILVRK